MSLAVHPDPQEPAGGFAFLELPEGSLGEDTAHVAVFDAYAQRWLAAAEAAGERIGIGDPHWQQERFEFGPYKVYRHQNADWVRIGPEIVNKIEEYAPLQIHVGAQAHDVTWPDNVPPRAGAAVLGGLRPVQRESELDDKTVLMRPVEPPQPEPEAEPEPAAVDLPSDTVAPPKAQTGEDSPRRWGALLLVVLLLALIGAGAAAWWYWPFAGASDRDVAGAETGNGVNPALADDETCTLDALSALPGGFAAIGAAMRECGKSVSPDTALSLVEDYAARDDADALLLFGTLYDGEILDAKIEKLIGLTFPADDTLAVEYYARAGRAGADGASERLSAACQRLQGANSTLAKGAYDEFCG